MIRVMGVDIPRGWSVVDVAASGRSSVAALGELDEGREVEHFVDLASKYNVARVAIETPLEPYLFGRGSAGNGEGVRRSVIKSLMVCSRLAGRIEQAAIVMGLPVVVKDADTVRRAFGIGGQTLTERDNAVKSYVKTHVRGWPKMSNKDERDAAVVAIYGGKTIVGVKR